MCGGIVWYGLMTSEQNYQSAGHKKYKTKFLIGFDLALMLQRMSLDRLDFFHAKKIPWTFSFPER
jgi:hypothetical protein